MPLTPEQIEAAIHQAREFWDQGKVAVTDLICQSLLAQNISSAEVILILGQVAGGIGEYATARRYLEMSCTAFPAQAAEALAEVNRLERERRLSAPPGTPRQRFHLIKAWGFGLTADLDHTLGHLLLAEMDGRIPVIHWGQNSLFRDAHVENAWTQFFEPVSPFNIADLIRAQHSFRPGKWSVGNLRREELNKWQGPDSKTAGVTLLNQAADVTVGDFFTAPIELLPWYAARHPDYVPGQIGTAEIEQTYRYLIEKYLKPNPRIIEAVERFATENFRNRKVQAVHVRGSDKVQESPDVADHRRIVFQTVQADLTADPSLWIFLLTDDLGLLEVYRTSLPGRIITTDCTRTSGAEGVHYSQSANRSQLGFEVLRDAYVAARCDSFLGLGSTNVSNFIMHLKAWPAGSLRIAGPVLHHQRSELIV
jgi:hypothetical protein